MDAGIKAEWCSRLRDGKREQGTEGFLRSGTEYCCLGVLAEMAEEAGVIQTEEAGIIGTPFTYFVAANDEKWSSAIPPRIAEWAGLDPKEFGTLGVMENLPDGHWNLAMLNDSGDFSFKDIADIIEERL